MATRKPQRVRIRGRLLTEAETRRRAQRIHKNALSRKRAAENDPTRITQPLTPKLLKQERESAERLRFGGEQRQIESEGRISDAQQTNIDKAFDLYSQRLAAIQSATKDAYDQGAAQIASRGSAASSQAEEQRKALEAAARADAEKRGVEYRPTNEATAQQAAAARQSSTNAAANLVTTLGTNQGAYLLDQGRIGERQRVDEKSKEAARRRLIEKAMRDLEGEKGDFRVQYNRDARDTERKYGLERAAFALDEYEAQQEAREARSKARHNQRESARDQANEDRDFGLDERTQAERERANRAREENTRRGQDKSGKNKSRFTSSQRRSAATRFRRAVALIRQGDFRRNQGQGAVNFALDEIEGLDPILARAAAMHAIYGGVDKKTRQKVHREFGIYLRQSRSSRSRPRSTSAIPKNKV